MGESVIPEQELPRDFGQDATEQELSQNFGQGESEQELPWDAGQDATKQELLQNFGQGEPEQGLLRDFGQDSTERELLQDSSQDERKQSLEKTEHMMHALDNEMELVNLDLRTYSPLTLAYIGDAAYELAIRTLIVRQENCPVQKLHRRTSTLVKAEAQAEFLEKLLPVLTEEEANVYRRGRNAKFHTRAKHAGERDYRKATGFETLMGYLYLSGETRRLLELVQIALEGVDLRQIDARNHHG